MQPSFVAPPVVGRGRPVPALLGDALRRPGGRRAVSVLSLVLFLAGAVMFAYPLGTDLYSRYHQGQLHSELQSPQAGQQYRENKVPVGEGLTRLRIPKIGLDVVVVQGTTASALRAGAGHYVDTPLPGQPGNVGIAGHRTTYGRPFNRLDELAPGDTVELETPFDVFTYKAIDPFAGHGNPWVVLPTQYEVLSQDVQGSFLTLTTCNPKGSAKQRLIMRFQLVSSRPLVKQKPA